MANEIDFARIRKQLNQQQTKLRTELTSPCVDRKAFDLFHLQHSQLHSAQISHENEPWSYEDTLLDDLPWEWYSQIPGNSQHSIAWLVWHMARVEDVTMNLLVAGTQQVYHRDNWSQRIKFAVMHTGNEMTSGEIREMSQEVEPQALRAYRQAVGSRTTEIVRGLSPQHLKKKVDPHRIQQLKDGNALLPSAFGIADYWSKRDIAGLLLMPATRHNLVHLNEISRLKNELI
jgi:hypothetical protein